MVEEQEVEQEEGLQMSFLDHLDELRKRLIHSFIAIGIAFMVCFAISDYLYDFLQKPVLVAIDNAYRRHEAKFLGQDRTSELKEGDQVQYTFAQDGAIQDVRVGAGTTVPAKIVRKGEDLAIVLAQPWLFGRTLFPAGTELLELHGEDKLPPPGYNINRRLVVRTVTAPFMLKMKVAMYAALAFAIPFLLYQAWAFVSPGLYHHEKKYIAPVLGMGTILFIAGAAFGYYIAFPAACDYLLGLAEGIFQTLIDAEEYLDLILIIMLGLGLVFQIPTVAFILGRIGLITPGMLWRSWRYAVVIIAILSAVLTPTADAFNMMVFAAPMLVLYFISIGIVWMFGKPRRSDAEVEAQG